MPGSTALRARTTLTRTRKTRRSPCLDPGPSCPARMVTRKRAPRLRTLLTVSWPVEAPASLPHFQLSITTPQIVLAERQIVMFALAASNDQEIPDECEWPEQQLTKHGMMFLLRLAAQRSRWPWATLSPSPYPAQRAWAGTCLRSTILEASSVRTSGYKASQCRRKHTT